MRSFCRTVLFVAMLCGRLAIAQSGSNAPPATEVPAPAPQGDAQELAKKLANPIASLISVPFQSAFDFGLGARERGFRYTLNFQPVIPIALNRDWNVISRTVTPIIHQSDVIPGTGQTGLSDI